MTSKEQQTTEKKKGVLRMDMPDITVGSVHAYGPEAAWPGPARPGLARPGPARPGLARTSPARPETGRFFFQIPRTGLHTTL